MSNANRCQTNSSNANSSNANSSNAAAVDGSASWVKSQPVRSTFIALDVSYAVIEALEHSPPG